MQRNVTNVLVACGAVFVGLYVPGEVLGPIHKAVGNGWAMIIRAGLSVPIALTARWFIFAQDHLATGTSEASLFFRFHYPSTRAIARYELSQDRAVALWFDFFNPCEQSDHPLHAYHLASFKASYGLRMIYYFKRALIVFVVGGCVAVMASSAFDASGDRELLPARVVCIIASTMVLTWLHASNRVSRQGELPEGSDRYQATGAFYKYKEIQGVLWEKFDEFLRAQPGIKRR